MELRQRQTLRTLFVPELTQSLKILALPLLELNDLIDRELEDNPFLEEPPYPRATPLRLVRQKSASDEQERALATMTRKPTLHEVLLRQLGIAGATDDELMIGREIIGNINENGYLAVTVEEIAGSLDMPVEHVERVLGRIQQFEPAGVGARSVRECLLIQLALYHPESDLARRIVAEHLESVARKNYRQIAKSLHVPLAQIEECISLILKLDPKPGRNYSAEHIQQVIPDVSIHEKGDGLEVTVNDEDMSLVQINKAYAKILKNESLSPQAREFLAQKLQSAMALVRAVAKRKLTLHQIVEVIVDFQAEAIRNDLSDLKPLTFRQIAQRLGINESTVCRALMNKYAQLPDGIVALKDFFPVGLKDQDGKEVSSVHVKALMKALLAQEDCARPLSDQALSRILCRDHKLKLPRRTVAKYRQELKVLPSSLRRKR